MTTKYSRPRAPETNTAQFFLQIIFCWRFRPTEKTPTIICLSSQIQITVRYLFSQKKNQRSMTICNTSAPHRLCSRSTVYWLRFREQSAHSDLPRPTERWTEPSSPPPSRRILSQMRTLSQHQRAHPVASQLLSLLNIEDGHEEFLTGGDRNDF